MTDSLIILPVVVLEIACLLMITLGVATLKMIYDLDGLEGIPGINRELMDGPAKMARRNVFKAMGLAILCLQLMTSVIVLPAPVWLAATVLAIGGAVSLVSCFLLVKFFINICEHNRDHRNEMQNQMELARERRILDGPAMH